MRRISSAANGMAVLHLASSACLVPNTAAENNIPYLYVRMVLAALQIAARGSSQTEMRLWRLPHLWKISWDILQQVAGRW